MDNISRSGLVNMCRYMGLPPFGNDNFLRFQLRSKLRAITQVHSSGVKGWLFEPNGAVHHFCYLSFSVTTARSMFDAENMLGEWF